jgi:hypothetical protein
VPAGELTTLSATATSATTTPLDPDPLGERHVVFTENSQFSFSSDQCVPMGNGVYQCARPADDATTVGEAGVFAAPDADGDREIFMKVESELMALTDNLLLDDSPYYDAVSDTVVWHRLLNGRYQIMSYDRKTKTETQVTNDTFNNREPSRHGRYTVWQGWVGSDWEIFVSDGETTTMITDNQIQDVAPSVNGSFVVWQTFVNNAWNAELYNIDTRERESLGETNGTLIQNPRFVLVYDAQLENGDIETIGFDLESKRAVPLSATPRSLPTELPSPEQTGEERALVGVATPSIKSKDTGQSSPDPVTDPPLPITDESDLIIPPFVSSTATDQSTSTDQATDDSVPTPTTTPPIHDLIVTPYVEPIANPGDPQSGVAESD